MAVTLWHCHATATPLPLFLGPETLKVPCTAIGVPPTAISEMAIGVGSSGSNPRIGLVRLCFKTGIGALGALMRGIAKLGMGVPAGDLSLCLQAFFPASREFSLVRAVNKLRLGAFDPPSFTRPRRRG